MTSDRDSVVQALRDLPRSGSTNLAAGIQTALAELEANGRPGSSRVIMLVYGRQSNEKKAYDAAVKVTLAWRCDSNTFARDPSKKGGSILDTIAWATGGSFVQVSDPTMLPQAFLDLRTTGVDSVTLSVNGSEPVAARLAGGTFTGNVAARRGRKSNRRICDESGRGDAGIRRNGQPCAMRAVPPWRWQR